ARFGSAGAARFDRGTRARAAPWSRSVAAGALAPGVRAHHAARGAEGTSGAYPRAAHGLSSATARAWAPVAAGRCRRPRGGWFRGAHAPAPGDAGDGLRPLARAPGRALSAGAQGVAPWSRHLDPAAGS